MFVLGNNKTQYSFNSKEELKGILLSWLKNQEEGKPLPNSICDLLYFLLQNHHDRNKKIGGGIKYFTVGKHPTGNKCFIIIRKDGTSDDFSYLKCLEKTGNFSDKKRVLNAMRKAIVDQTMAFKENELKKGISCQFNGIELTNSNSEVDHKIPFQLLVDNWLQLNHLNYDSIANQLVKVNTIESLPTQLLNNWKNYHFQNAKLRLISASANRSMG